MSTETLAALQQSCEELAQHLQNQTQEELGYLSQILLEELQPEISSPYPATCVSQFSTPLDLPAAGFSLKAGTALNDKATGYRWETQNDVTIRPLKIVNQQVNTKELSLELETTSSFQEQNIDRLCFYIDAQESTATHWLWLFCKKLITVEWVFPGDVSQKKPLRITPCPASFQDYFCAPSSLFFFELSGLNLLDWPQETHAEIHFHFSEIISCNPLSPAQLRLDCGVLQQRAIIEAHPIRHDLKNLDYDIAFPAPYTDALIAQIIDVCGVTPTGKRFPYSADPKHEHHYQRRGSQLRLLGAKEKQTISIQAEVYPTLYPNQTQSFQEIAPLEIQATPCQAATDCFFSLPKASPFDELRVALQHSHQPQLTAKQLRDYLKALPNTENENTQKKMAALQQLDYQSVYLWKKGQLWPCIETRLIVDEKGFSDTADLWLFGETLFYFLREKTAHHCLISLTLNTNSQQNLLTWPAHIGQADD